MDFPVCPSCGQSVIDDEAEDCPFCGASMSAKPGRKPAPQQATKPTPAKPAAATGSAAAASRPPSAKAPPAKAEAAGDPISADTAAMKRAIPASRKPMKGRTYEVKCPMCETVGYVPEQAAGKDVKCANPQCLVPVFTAPEKRREVVAEEPKKSALSGGALVGLSVLALLIGGGLVWYFVLGGNEPEAPPPVAAAPTTKRNEFTPVFQSNARTDAQTARTDEPAAPTSVAELTPLALTELPKVALQREQNRNKPLCRRLAAEAHAVAGDLAGAHAQIEALRNVGSAVPYYEVTPLVEIAWKEQAAGRSEEVRKAVDQAVKVAARLPQVGRASVDAATELASVLVTLDRNEEARALIQKHASRGSQGTLSALLHIVEEFHTYDLDTAASNQPVLHWSEPQWVAVTLGAAAHGAWEPALAWARQAPSAESQADCLVAWAEAVAGDAILAGRPLPQTQLDKARELVPDAARVRIAARVAAMQLLAGDRAGAEATIADAKTLLAALPSPGSIPLPENRALVNRRLPDPVPLRMAATAAAEIARVQVALEQNDAAWESLAQGLAFARGIAPSLSVVRDRSNEMESGGTSAMRDRLKRELELPSDDAARRAQSDYRKKLNEFGDAATIRFNLQAALLRSAIEWGLLDPAATELQDRVQQAAADEREPYLETSLPSMLVARYRDAGSSSRAAAFEAFASAGSSPADTRDELVRTTLRQAKAGEYAEAAAAVLAFAEDPDYATQWGLQLCCRLINEGEPKRAFDFIAAFEQRGAGTLFREDAYQLSGARAAQEGEALLVWTDIRPQIVEATEKAALLRGMVAGIATTPARPPGEPTGASTPPTAQVP